MKISCGSCQKTYEYDCPFTLQIQEAVEGQPCPWCGAYTLRCHEPAVPPARLALSERRRLRGESGRAVRPY